MIPCKKTHPNNPQIQTNGQMKTGKGFLQSQNISGKKNPICCKNRLGQHNFFCHHSLALK